MTVLVDSAVWIDHLRQSDSVLKALLDEGQVLIHPWIVGELALGSIANRDEFLNLLAQLPAVEEVAADRVLSLIQDQTWFSQGIGWVDAQILAACLLHPCRLLTSDRRLREMAIQIGIAWPPSST